MNRFPILLVVIFGVLLAGASTSAQTTVFDDDFSANTGAAYTTAGFIGDSVFEVTRSGADFGARRNTSPAQLELTNDVGATANANGWIFARTATGNFSAPYNTTLGSIPGLVTWNFNMRQIRTDPAGFAAGSYGVAFALGASSTLISTSGSGYAVVLGQSGATDPVRLVKFTGGLQGTLTNIITSNTTGLTDFGAEYLSIRVTYDPATDQWELFLRNDGTTEFADPASGTLISQGSATDATYTETPLGAMGGYWQGATAAAQTAFFDNVSVLVGSAPVLPDLAINDVSQDEGNAGSTDYTFTVSLSTANHGGVTFDIATADHTATVAGSDYAANSLTGQTIPNGTQFYQFTVSVVGDATVEPDETFFVNITNVTGANVIDGQGQGTLVNDDAVAVPTVEFGDGSYFDDESQTATITVNRTGSLSGTTMVDYATQGAFTRGGSAATGGAACTSGVDFINASGTLIFGAGESFKEIEIRLCGDPVTDGNEFFVINLSNPSGGVLGGISSATVFINDTANAFVNPVPISIGTGGDSYDSSIEVSGVPGSIGGLRVTLYDFEHLKADDIDVLLVGPQGQKFLLMADAGGDDGLLEGATITFDDAAGQVLPDFSQIFSGRFEPTSWEFGQADFPAPAPAGPYNEPGSEVGGPVTLASVFGGTNANGTWTLYIRDDNSGLPRRGADGVVAGGWGLQFFTPTAASASIAGQVRSAKSPISNATIVITGGSLTGPLYTRTNNFGNYKFEGLTVGETYVVTVVSKRYNFPQSSLVLNLADSVVGADFEAEDK